VVVASEATIRDRRRNLRVGVFHASIPLLFALGLSSLVLSLGSPRTNGTDSSALIAVIISLVIFAVAIVRMLAMRVTIQSGTVECRNPFRRFEIPGDQIVGFSIVRLRYRTQCIAIASIGVDGSERKHKLIPVGPSDQPRLEAAIGRFSV
jgi:hypothetical protein